MAEVFDLSIEIVGETHTVVRIYNRGEDAGPLTIRNKDVPELVRLFTGATVVDQDIGTLEEGSTAIGAVIGKLGG